MLLYTSLQASISWDSFMVNGSNMSFPAPKSSMWMECQVESFWSRLSQGTLSAEQKSWVFWIPSPQTSFGSCKISAGTKLFLVLPSEFLPHIKLLIMRSKILHFFGVGIRSSLAICEILLSTKVLTTVILPNIVRLLYVQLFIAFLTSSSPFFVITIHVL